MIVLDASALMELLLHTQVGGEIASRIADPTLSLHIPHLADVEIIQTLRRYVRESEISSVEAAAALATLRDLDLFRHSHEPLLHRIWALREKVSAYDAAYIALAEALDARLLTCDRRLSRAPHASRRIELFSP